MVILFLLFLIQFSVACACLGVNMKQQEQLAEQVSKYLMTEAMNCANNFKKSVLQNILFYKLSDLLFVVFILLSTHC